MIELRPLPDRLPPDSSSRWPKSLWRKIVFSQWAWRTPSIIELWFQASDSRQAIRHQFRQGRDAGLVRHIAGGEDQRCFLAVQIGKLALQFDQRMIIAGDIAGAAGAGAHPGRGLDHGADHLRVLAHAQIVVRAPDHDVLRPLRRMPHRMRKPPGDALEIGKYPIAPLVMQPRQRVGEIAGVINVRIGRRGSSSDRSSARVSPAPSRHEATATRPEYF